MTNYKSTRRALFTSMIALLLCFAMLLGMTFAWFTDSVVSGSNVIKAGILDIDVQYTLGDEDENGDLVWKHLDGATNLFQKDLWEPGHTEVVALKIANNGTLALKYVANMNIMKETVGKTADGADIILSDILTVSTLVQQTGAVGDIAVALAFGGENRVAYETTASLADGNVLRKDVELFPGDAHYMIVKVDMPETVGSEANAKDKDSVPSIEFGINVLATQLVSEKDSFGKDYDAKANYPVLQANGNVYSLLADATLTDTPLYSSTTATEAVTINGNGNTVTGVVSSADKFTWIGGTIPEMSTIFSSENGAKVTVNDLTFTGTMSAIMLGNYRSSTYTNYNTELNNVNVIDAEVVSFSSGVSPAVCVYGTATLNNCIMTGTKLSALDTDPMWPAYDVVAVNYTDLTLNNSKIGSIYMWNQAKVTVADGSEVGTIEVRGNMNTTKYGLVIESGAKVGVIDLRAITDLTRVNITVEDGATVGEIILPASAAGKAAAVIDGKVQILDAASVNSSEEFKNAVSADIMNIVVELNSDVTYDVAAWENNAMGGASTKNIVINGNGHTITFNQTNSDWNNIVTNNGAKLVINNAKITSSGHNDGPWNRHDLNFACDVELNNVTSDKAIALKAGGILNNVTISDANTSDTYALWIQPNGQTVALYGCTIDMIACTDGRGIKIDEQYVSAAQKVTLVVENTTFKTEEKSAILVKSAAGADITLENVDISGVAADSTNAVWVDEASEAYEALVTVTGGTVIVEP